MKRRTSTVLVTSTPTQRFKSWNANPPRNPLARTQVLVKPRYGKSLTNPYTRPSIEKKNVDTAGSVGNTGTNTFSEIDHLNFVANGNSSISRIGRKIQMKSIFLRWVTSTNVNNAPIRIVIIYDRSPQQALPSITEIFTSSEYNAHLNLNNTDRFVVIADEVRNANWAAGAGQSSGTIYRKLNLDAMYNSGAGDIASQTSGAVYVMSSALGGIGAGIGYNCRIRFTDV